ncbi:hypothetical protein B0A49_06055 [Cryomyces minteri]|uniref:Major facilitator superfamily (MFS) profile domain-containing protein n=1 Tax=Cryomyces minteri TaxID=331657 RepID=A0A4U0X7N5_9PEZI|nr:hypothetical protein B0A49_06055 [Cryomyces minteri]
MLAGYKGRPEDRLPVAMVGGILFPITMFWFAWTAEYNSIHWIVPTIAGVFLSTSILLIFVAYLNYLTDTYLMFAASALAANTVCRSAFGAAAPLYTQYMFDALGVGGGGSLIGGVAVLLVPIPFIFYRYGEPIRKRSKFAPTPEKDADEKQETTERDVSGPRGSVSDIPPEGEAELGVGPGRSDTTLTGGERHHDYDTDADRDVEKGMSPAENDQTVGGDQFIDASDMEKAETTNR